MADLEYRSQKIAIAVRQIDGAILSLKTHLGHLVADQLIDINFLEGLNDQLFERANQLLDLVGSCVNEDQRQALIANYQTQLLPEPAGPPVPPPDYLESGEGIENDGEKDKPEIYLTAPGDPDFPHTL